MAARTSRSEPASESASLEGLDGAGVIGDAIGITNTQLMTTTGTAPGAIRFSIETITIAKEACGALRPTWVALRPASVAEVLAAAVRFTTARAERLGLSPEIPGLLEDMPNPAVRAASAPVPSAATTMADRYEVFRHAEPPASVVAEGFTAVVAEGFTAVVAAIDNRSFVMLPLNR
jgi:hypothetical protein